MCATLAFSLICRWRKSEAWVVRKSTAAVTKPESETTSPRQDLSIALDCHSQSPWMPEQEKTLLYKTGCFSLNTVGCHVSTMFWINPLMSEPVLWELPGETTSWLRFLENPLYILLASTTREMPLLTFQIRTYFPSNMQILLPQTLCLYIGYLPHQSPSIFETQFLCV